MISLIQSILNTTIATLTDYITIKYRDLIGLEKLTALKYEQNVIIEVR